MDMNQKALSKDLISAISAVLAKHCVPVTNPLAKIQPDGTLMILIPHPAAPATAAPVAGHPTPNAIARYKKYGAKLGLPKIGTMLMVSGKEYVLLGLSSDCSRVKAGLIGSTLQPAELPLAAAQAAIAAAGAKMVADLDKAEQAQPDDAVDPELTALLVALGKKPATKPAEGQQ